MNKSSLSKNTATFSKSIELRIPVVIGRLESQNIKELSKVMTGSDSNKPTIKIASSSVLHGIKLHVSSTKIGLSSREPIIENLVVSK